MNNLFFTILIMGFFIPQAHSLDIHLSREDLLRVNNINEYTKLADLDILNNGGQRYLQRGYVACTYCAVANTLAYNFEELRAPSIDVPLMIKDRCGSFVDERVPFYLVLWFFKKDRQIPLRTADGEPFNTIAEIHEQVTWMHQDCTAKNTSANFGINLPTSKSGVFSDINISLSLKQNFENLAARIYAKQDNTKAPIHPFNIYTFRLNRNGNTIDDKSWNKFFHEVLVEKNQPLITTCGMHTLIIEGLAKDQQGNYAVKVLNTWGPPEVSGWFNVDGLLERMAVIGYVTPIDDGEAEKPYILGTEGFSSTLATRDRVALASFVNQPGFTQDDHIRILLTIIDAVDNDFGDEQLSLLLDANIDVNVSMSRPPFWNALAYACSKNRSKATKLLLDRNANLEQSIENGFTPLKLALMNGHDASVALLLAYGAKVDGETLCLSSTDGQMDKKPIPLANAADMIGYSSIAEKLIKAQSSYCAFCKKRPNQLKQCSRCKQIKYCNAACQQKHWPEHKHQCATVPARRPGIK